MSECNCRVKELTLEELERNVERRVAREIIAMVSAEMEGCDPYISARELEAEISERYGVED